MRKVLVVDDQPAVRTALQLLLEVHGIPSLTATCPRETLEVVEREELGAAILDMNFSEDTTSGQEGVALFSAIRERDNDLPVILLTAWTSLETAVQLVKAGAADYLAKPWDDVKLVQTLQNLLRLRDLSLENRRLRAAARQRRAELASKYDLCRLLYTSTEMHNLVSLAVQVAPADVPVLITGPNGSGKEKLAEIVQANSRRCQQPFIRVNAGALPDDLLEAELFGAEAGAYTGATKRRLGRFESADGGTLFMDEVGNLSLAGQIKLLRVLQTGEYERLGNSDTRRCNVRVISATNANLKQAIADGTFREDLFFRLAVVELRVPRLAERVDDIVPLAGHFLRQASLSARSLPDLGQAAADALLAHDWPGNVRELQNRIQRAVLVCDGPTITAADLDLDPRAENTVHTAAAGSAESSVRATTKGAVNAELDPKERDERAAIEAALVEANGIVAHAAALLGVSRQTLYRRMERLGISLQRRIKP